MSTETKLQLFDLCVQQLAENDKAEHSKESVKIGFMANHDAYMSIIYNFFKSHEIDEERRATLKTTLFNYALASTWLYGYYTDYCYDNKLTNLAFEEYLNVHFIASEDYHISEATGNNGTKHIPIGTLCLVSEMLSLL